MSEQHPQRPERASRRALLRRTAGIAGLGTLSSITSARPGLADTDTRRTSNTAGEGQPPETDRPLTIPALTTWYARDGAVQLQRSSRIVVPPRTRRTVVETARLFAEDIRRLTGAEYSVERNNGATRAGDIRLALDTEDTALGAEGYDLKIGDAIDITAPRPAGVFYATSTVLQLLHQGLRIPAGWARDRPRYPERGLMVDNGRRHYSVDWFRTYIREMAYLKLNYLHLHFTEDQGWRIESETYPRVVSEKHLTKSQVRELLELADQHFITVVPEIDMPAHMGAALEAYPQYQLRNAAARTEDQQRSVKLDITDPEALGFARELIEEYLDLFPGEYWHVGADEWMAPGQSELYPKLREHARERYGSDANAHDALIGFVNWVDRIVRSHGKRTRMWHDEATFGSALRLNPEITMEWWTDYAPLSSYPDSPKAQELLDRGHQVMNCGWYPTYVAEIGEVNGLSDVETAYESWNVHQFHDGSEMFWNNQYGITERRGIPYPVPPTHVPPPEEISPDEPRNLGSKLQVWGDSRYSEDQIEDFLVPRLRMMSQKTGESPLLTPDYEAFVEVMKRVGHAPGTGPDIGEMPDS